MCFLLNRKSKSDEEKLAEERESEGETNVGFEEEDDDGRTKL